MPLMPSRCRTESDVDAPSYTMDPNPNRFALVVGVEEYAGLPAADFAARDAAAVRAHLTALGYPASPEHRRPDQQPGRARQRRQVPRVVAARARQGRRRACSCTSPATARPAPKTGAALPHALGRQREIPGEHRLPARQLYASLNALPAKEDRRRARLVLLRARVAVRSWSRARTPLVRTSTRGAAPTGRPVVFSAAGDDEVAAALPDQGHGLFTYYFLKGLNGAAKGAGRRRSKACTSP